MTDHDGHTQGSAKPSANAAPMPSTEGLRDEIADVLRSHLIECSSKGDGTVTCRCHEGGWMPLIEYRFHVAEAIAPHVVSRSEYERLKRELQHVTNGAVALDAERDRLAMELEEASDLSAQDALHLQQAHEGWKATVARAQQLEAQLTQAREALTALLSSGCGPDCASACRHVSGKDCTGCAAIEDQADAALAAITQEPTP